jgi:hypothetical protein
LGVKKILEPFHVMQASKLPLAVTGTNTYLSLPIGIKNLDNVLLQLIWTGTVTGTFTILHSPDGALYDSIPVSPSITQPAGSAGHWSVVLQLDPAQWLQVQYVNASGTGTVDVIVTGKDTN